MFGSKLTSVERKDMLREASCLHDKTPYTAKTCWECGQCLHRKRTLIPSVYRAIPPINGNKYKCDDCGDVMVEARPV